MSTSGSVPGQQAHLHHATSHGIGFVPLPLSPLLALPYVTCFAPVVQAVAAHAVPGEVTGRLLLAT